MKRGLVFLCVIACGGDDGAVQTESGQDTSSAATTTPDDSSSGVPTSTTVDPSTTTTPAESSSGDPDGSSSDGGGTSGDEASSSGGEESTGPIPKDCDGIEVIELQGAYAEPIDAASWEPGGSVTIGVSLHNTSNEDFLDYPSIVVTPDDPLVSPESANNSLFALLADMTAELTVIFVADDAIRVGTEVTFTIQLAVLDEVCPNGQSVQVSATIE